MVSSTSGLPSAADHGERLNRMNMVLAKHSSALAALKRSNPSPSTPATSTVYKVAESKKTKSSFSALKNQPSASGPAATTTANTSKPPQQRKGDEDDDNFGSSNTGIGFVRAGKDIAQDERSAATRDLRGRLLGKRAREQKEDAAAARKKKYKGMAVDDESDEDEGRSKIGKGRKKGGKGKGRKVDDE